MQEYLLTRESVVPLTGEYTLTDSGVSPIVPYELPYDTGSENDQRRLSTEFTYQEIKYMIPDRIARGQYVNTGDDHTFSFADWSQQVSLKNNFMSSDVNSSMYRQTTLATNLSVPITAAHLPSSIMQNRDGKKRLMAAALYALIYKDYAVKAKLRTAHLWQWNYDNTDVKNHPAHFPTSGSSAMGDDNSNMWWMSTHLSSSFKSYTRNAIILDEGDTDVYSAGEHLLARDYYLEWARYLMAISVRALKNAYPNWDNVDFLSNPQRFYSHELMYWERNPNGTATPYYNFSYSRFPNNRRWKITEFIAMVGLYYNDADLIAHAKKFYEAFFTYAVFPTMDTSEIERMTSQEDDEGLLYGGASLVSAAEVADMFVRYGDTSLLDMAITDGSNPSTISGVYDMGTKSAVPKTLQSTILHLGEYSKIVPTQNKYATQAAALAEDVADRFDFRDGTRNFEIDSTAACIAGKHIRTQDIKDISERTGPHRPKAANGEGVGADAPTYGFFQTLGATWLIHGGREGAYHPVSNPCVNPDEWDAVY
jgi:hypothetical protein